MPRPREEEDAKVQEEGRPNALVDGGATASNKTRTRVDLYIFVGLGTRSLASLCPPFDVGTQKFGVEHTQKQTGRTPNDHFFPGPGAPRPAARCRRREARDWGRFLISMADPIFDPAKPDQDQDHRKKGEKREKKGRKEREERKGEEEEKRGDTPCSYLTEVVYGEACLGLTGLDWLSVWQKVMP